MHAGGAGLGAWAVMVEEVATVGGVGIGAEAVAEHEVATVGGTGFGAGAVEVEEVATLGGAGLGDWAAGEIGVWGSRAEVIGVGAGTFGEGFFLAAT